MYSDEALCFSHSSWSFTIWASSSRASESTRSSSRNRHSGSRLLNRRIFSFMSTSKGFALLVSTARQSSMTRSRSSSFFSSTLLQLLHFGGPVDRLDGDDVGAPVKDGEDRRSDHQVLGCFALLHLREDHLEHRLPVLGVHVNVELVHRPHRRDYPPLKGEYEGHQGDRSLAAALGEGVKGCGRSALEPYVERNACVLDVGAFLEFDETTSVSRGEDGLVGGVGGLHQVLHRVSPDLLPRFQLGEHRLLVLLKLGELDLELVDAPRVVVVYLLCLVRHALHLLDVG